MATQNELILEVKQAGDGKKFVYLPKSKSQHLNKGNYVIVQKLGYKLTELDQNEAKK